MRISHTQTGFTSSSEVQAAREAGKPVVALESTLIAHAFPPGERHEVAVQIEDAVRAAGAVPATIAILDGQVHIGLEPEELTRLTEAEDVWKVSIDNLPLCLAAGAIGATTVASTTFLAGRAGIDVFATGGLGGVHRGANETFDVSADLHVLASASLVVVCAGVKSILDTAATLEVLETLGVSVATLGTERFPGFYVEDSGLRTASVRSVEAAGDALLARRQLGLPGSIVFAFRGCQMVCVGGVPDSKEE